MRHRLSMTGGGGKRIAKCAILPQFHSSVPSLQWGDPSQRFATGINLSWNWHSNWELDGRCPFTPNTQKYTLWRHINCGVSLTTKYNAGAGGWRMHEFIPQFSSSSPVGQSPTPSHKKSRKIQEPSNEHFRRIMPHAVNNTTCRHIRLEKNKLGDHGLTTVEFVVPVRTVVVSVTLLPNRNT